MMKDANYLDIVPCLRIYEQGPHKFLLLSHLLQIHHLLHILKLANVEIVKWQMIVAIAIIKLGRPINMEHLFNDNKVSYLNIVRLTCIYE